MNRQEHPHGQLHDAVAAALPSAILFRCDVPTVTHLESSKTQTAASTVVLASVAASIDAAVVGISPDGRVVVWNPSAESLFQLAATATIGRLISTVILSDANDVVEMLAALLSRVGLPQQDVRALSRDLAVAVSSLTVDDDAAQDRRTLQGQLLTIVEQEKRRIGQDLHDDIGQELTGLGLTAETLYEALDDYSLPEADLAARLSKSVRRTLQKVRRISRGLMPVEVDAGGLTAALLELTVQLEHADDIRCTFDCRQPVTVSDNQVATQLYRIAQEATANAVRHARARRIEVSLDSHDGIVILEIRDDGIGIDVSARRHGNGLQIMQHRAGLIGATLSIGPGAGNGTHVSCRLPEGDRFVGREP